MFKRLSGAREASRRLLDRCHPIEAREILPLESSNSRVLASDLFSNVNMPGFNRAAMDGYAVRSADTRSASPNSPVYLALGSDCAPVRTGMPVPEEFDAVVMVEDTLLRGDQVEVTAQLHPWRNVSRAGEDISQGELVLKEGHRLRPPDLAFLGELGVEAIDVYSRPKITVVPTGGELVPRGLRPIRPGEAYETNALMASLYIRSWGGEPDTRGIVPDDPGLIKEAISSGLSSDMVVLIGGTSVGEKDYAPRVLVEMGELMIHGVRITPGKPTAIGIVGTTPVVCLPGYPMAALSALYLFVRPALKKLAHLKDSVPSRKARLARKVASKAGYLSMLRVSLKEDEAVPIMSSGAGIMSSVARADGFVLVPEEAEGLEAGDVVEVNLFE